MKHSLVHRACRASCVVSLAGSIPALALEIQCPSQISMLPAVVTDAPSGWQALQRRTLLPVQSVVMTIGPLDRPRQLKPDIRIVKGSKTFAWEFIHSANDEGIWLYCGYGNTILLAQKLSARVSRCQARETATSDGQATMTTTCQ